MAEARTTDGVRVLQLKEFLELMKWGIVMGVRLVKNAMTNKLTDNSLAAFALPSQAGSTLR